MENIQNLETASNDYVGENPIDELFDLLHIKLDEWYWNQPFEVLHSIFNIEYLFNLSEDKLEQELDELRGEWISLTTNEKYYFYRMYRYGNKFNK